MKISSAAIFALLTVFGSTSFADNFALNDPQRDYPGSPENPLTQSLITELYSRNEAGQVLAAWEILAAQKDGYAHSATKIFGKKITVGKCVVESNWDVVVGKQVRDQLFDAYAKLYQRTYIEFLDKNHRYPNSLEIEMLYRNSDEALGLPQSVSVDLMLNAVPAEWRKRLFFDRFSSLIGIGRNVEPKRWYDYTELSNERQVQESIAANNITADEAKAIYRKTTGRVAKCMVKKLKQTTPAPAND